MTYQEYMSALIGCFSAMSESEKNELHAWEKQFVDGSGEYGTSDWPGWSKYIGPRPISTEREVDSFGYVYLIRLSSGECKIGISKNVENRISNLQTANPNEINLLHTFPASNAREAESVLHQKFSHLRIRNEWYSLKKEDIEYIIAIKKYPNEV